MSLANMFASRRAVECDACGAGEDELNDIDGRLVCISCGVCLPGGSCISNQAAFSEQDNYAYKPPRNSSDSCPLINIVREKHPGCLNTAANLVNAVKDPPAKGMPVSEHTNLAQALAYIAFRVDGQSVTILDMAYQVNVPIERLRKDVKRMSERLGIASVSSVTVKDARDEEDDDDANGDVAAFKQSMLDVLRPLNLRASKVRVINVWCTTLFRVALAADDIDVINAPPKHTAGAILSIYSRQPVNPFGISHKRKRGDSKDDGGASNAMSTFVAELTRHPSARKVAAGMRKHIGKSITGAGSQTT